MTFMAFSKSATSKDSVESLFLPKKRLMDFNF